MLLRCKLSSGTANNNGDDDKFNTIDNNK
jgi:hypothetical protein